MVARIWSFFAAAENFQKIANKDNRRDYSTHLHLDHTCKMSGSISRNGLPTTAPTFPPPSTPAGHQSNIVTASTLSTKKASPPADSPTASSSFANSSTSLRLRKEFKAIKENPPAGIIDVSLSSNDSVLLWKVMMSIDTRIFSDSVIGLHLIFPCDFPQSAPIVEFCNTMFHPNVRQDTNRLCSDGKWSPVYDVSAFLVSVHALLSCPNLSFDGEKPANVHAYIMLTENYSHYVQNARSLLDTPFVSDDDTLLTVSQRDTWTCENCTYSSNGLTADKCAVCDSLRLEAQIALAMESAEEPTSKKMKPVTLSTAASTAPASNLSSSASDSNRGLKRKAGGGEGNTATSNSRR